MTTIYLLRHGKVDGPAALYGHTDIAVKDKENQYIAGLFSKYSERAQADIHHIYTSPLRRCTSLARAIAEEKSTVRVINSLKELNFGHYDGIAFDEIHQQQAQWQQLEKFWQDPVQYTLPGAELLTGFAYRVAEAWQKIVNSQRAEEKDALIVCHGGVIRMILASVLNVDYRNPTWYTQLSVANGSLTAIELAKNGEQVKHIAKPLIDLSAEHNVIRQNAQPLESVNAS